MRCNTIDVLITSKSIHYNLYATPKLKNVRYEMVAESQIDDRLFSDTIHTLWVTKGTLPTAKKADWMKQQEVRLSATNSSKLDGWLANFPLEEPRVAFEGSDSNKYQIVLDTVRAFIDSKLENDLKYRLGIQEYYVGKTRVCLAFTFNAASRRQTRARELLLRSNSLPIRLVRRLVG